VQIAECCDVDGFCYGDGTDSWCCDGRYFCTNDGPLKAAERGGIVCPIDPVRQAAITANIIGLVVMGMLVLLFLAFSCIPQKKVEHVVLINDEEDNEIAETEVTIDKEARRKAREKRKSQLLDKQRESHLDLENQKIKLAEFGEYGTGQIDSVHKDALNSALGVSDESKRRSLLSEQKELKKLKRKSLANITKVKQNLRQSNLEARAQEL
jgi:hypothetical protein